MPALPGSGVATYNKFVFPPDKTETVDLRITPVPDRSGRTFVGHRFSLTLRTILTGNPSDAAVTSAIVLLTQPAGGLVYTGRGVGDLTVNIGFGSADLRWGPIPKLVSLRPRGGERAVELTWQVEWEQMTCGDSADFGYPSEFVYTLEFATDQSGYTTRVYSATLRIPQSRRVQGDRRLRMTADEFRERINPAPVAGYRRIPGTVSISEDKCEMRLVVRDEQLPPNVPPPGVIQASADHRISSEPGKLLSWMGTITGSYELALGVPASAAYEAFFAMCRDRIPRNAAVAGRGLGLVGGGLTAGGSTPTTLIAGAETVAGLISPGALIAGRLAADFIGSKPANTPKSAILGIFPWQFSAHDAQIYDKTLVNLSLTYRIVGATRDQILTQHGLWKPVPGSNWQKWFTSIGSHVGPRGTTNIIMSPGDDEIIDLCRPTIPGPPPAPPRRTTGPGLRIAELRTGSGFPRPNARIGPSNAPNFLNLFPVPRKEHSWLDYFVGVTIESDSGNVVGRTLPPPTTAELTAGNSRRGRNTLLTDAAGETFVHQRARPTTYITLFGKCTRAGFPVPAPRIVSVDGQAPTLVSRPGQGEGFTQAILGNVGEGVPVYAAAWRMTYVLTGDATGGLPVPTNPLMT